MNKLLFSSAGAKYSKYPDIMKKVCVASMVSFKEEPENIYDPLAIQIFYDEYFCGYVPKNLTLNPIILAAIEQKKIFIIKSKNEHGFDMEEL